MRQWHSVENLAKTPTVPSTRNLTNATMGVRDTKTFSCCLVFLMLGGGCGIAPSL